MSSLCPTILPSAPNGEYRMAAGEMPSFKEEFALSRSVQGRDIADKAIPPQAELTTAEGGTTAVRRNLRQAAG